MVARSARGGPSLRLGHYVYIPDPRERSEHCSPRTLSRREAAQLSPGRHLDSQPLAASMDTSPNEAKHA